jgi:hypothetical protein
VKKFSTILALLFALNLAADGTVTTQPSADSVADWQIVSVCMHAATVSATIHIRWLHASGAEARLDSTLYVTAITITGAEVAQFIAAVSPAGTDTFSSTGNAAKRFRQRASKWLIDNGKLTRAANES